jgi:hypothetical protein
MCNKNGWSSYREAQTALHQFGRKLRSGGKVIGRLGPTGDKVPVRSYRCDRCPLWHHTSRNSKKKKGRLKSF